MKFVEKNLMPYETVVYKSSLHWIVLLPPIFILACGIALYTNKIESLSFVFFFLFLGTAIPSVVLFLTAEYVLTNSRVLMSVGVIKKKTLQEPIARIKEIKVKQSFVGKIFNFGSFTFRELRRTKPTFFFVTNPLEFRKQIREQVFVIQEKGKRSEAIS
ncbi:MAG: PH domain-containing protein [Calditrichaeota bacterium]|nr:MAG: PH domain-containing protein [Calditrichota bacterium]